MFILFHSVSFDLEKLSIIYLENENQSNDVYVLHQYIRAEEIPKFFENAPSKPSNGQPGLGQCKENGFESQ